MKDSAKYAKVVEWSEKDHCYVGSAPGLILGGCHGDDEKQVFEELCQIVDEVIELSAKLVSVGEPGLRNQMLFFRWNTASWVWP